MRYEGYNGQIEIGHTELVITRDGMKARTIFGKNTLARRIPIEALSGVRLKEPTRLKNGWVQLLLGGEDAPELSLGTAASNANAIVFTHGKRDQLHELHERLVALVARNAELGIDPTGIEWDDVKGQQGRFDRLASEDRAREKVEGRRAKAEAAGLRPDIAEKVGSCLKSRSFAFTYWPRSTVQPQPVGCVNSVPPSDP